MGRPWPPLPPRVWRPCLRATSVVHMKQNGAEDRKICAVTAHKNIASLSSYDIVTSHEAGILADVIDLKPPSYESACHEAPVATAVREPAFAAVDTDSLGAASTWHMPVLDLSCMLPVHPSAMSPSMLCLVCRWAVSDAGNRRLLLLNSLKRSEYSHFITLKKILFFCNAINFYFTLHLLHFVSSPWPIICVSVLSFLLLLRSPFEKKCRFIAQIRK